MIIKIAIISIIVAAASGLPVCASCGADSHACLLPGHCGVEGLLAQIRNQDKNRLMMTAIRER